MYAFAALAALPYRDVLKFYTDIEQFYAFWLFSVCVCGAPRHLGRAGGNNCAYNLNKFFNTGENGRLKKCNRNCKRLYGEFLGDAYVAQWVKKWKCPFIGKWICNLLELYIKWFRIGSVYLVHELIRYALRRRRQPLHISF